MFGRIEGERSEGGSGTEAEVGAGEGEIVPEGSEVEGGGRGEDKWGEGTGFVAVQGGLAGRIHPFRVNRKTTSQPATTIRRVI
jgi:hypothetical protein